ncbi:MAG TPA: beta-galactosidase, partial [Cyclobacteriaceae bacterium]|nr:beta-galactosidase [Cyclobacteriaceae bacterium]
MKRYCLLIAFLWSFNFIQAQSAWKMIEGKIVTPWAANVDPTNPLSEYPRPQLMRNNWSNLNGMW